MVDACYNIVKSKNLSIKLCQKMNNKKRKKSPSLKKREERRRKEWIKQKEDVKKTTKQLYIRERERPSER